MENTQDELKTHLMQSSDEFRQLAAQHADYKKRVTELEFKSHPTPEEILEEARLKKLKLQIKDQMTELLNRHREHQHV
ncbi:MAG TPA: YdcH family protein [Bryobacteraceae bacterium]|nr:YdcH family protein [Bryobacteraceae bacterium]